MNNYSAYNSTAYATAYPLRYKISDWRQLKNCESNLSRDLHINVSLFLDSKHLNGLRITVEHSKFGTMFSYIVDPKGSLVQNGDNDVKFELTTGQILAELKKWGFYIEFNPTDKLPGNQIQYLMILQQLHFDKIRILAVWDAPNGVKRTSVKIVAFNSEQNGDWMNASYSPSKKEFLDALNEGTAANLSAISETQNYRWDWLYNWIGDINDIIEGQSKIKL